MKISNRKKMEHYNRVIEANIRSIKADYEYEPPKDIGLDHHIVWIIPLELLLLYIVSVVIHNVFFN